MPPLVSVIIPCFNAGRMLRPALLSVARQSHPDIEIIFVDNNSTDGSAETARTILAGTGRAFTLTECASPGANHARNHGYTLARGDFIQWLDADDQLDPDKIALQVAALENDPRDAIAYGDWSAHRLVPGRPDMVERHTLRQVDDQTERTLAGIWYPPHSYLLRRTAADRLQQARGWWPDRSVATDVEYSALATLLGLRFRYVPGARVRYNIWSDGQTSNATPYGKRVASLRAIFGRLAEFVASGQAGIVLTARHNVLLHQGWDIWRMPPNSITVEKRSGRHFVARRRADGHRVELRPREAAIVRAMATGSPALVSLHHALALEPRVPEVTGDHVTIVRTIEMLQREGLLERITTPETAGSASARGP
jgi:glycosyltransferase involved in cell wall biosynthesis